MENEPRRRHEMTMEERIDMDMRWFNLVWVAFNFALVVLLVGLIFSDEPSIHRLPLFIKLFAYTITAIGVGAFLYSLHSAIHSWLLYFETIDDRY